MRIVRGFTLFALGFALFSCGPPKNGQTGHQRAGTYPVQDSSNEPVAAVVIERNGRFDVAAATGSAFLVEPKERGIFATAKHVVGLDVDYKLFFGGRVYKAFRILDHGVTDVGFLRIAEDFDPAGFPEPYPVADSFGLGDKAFVRGIHMHPADLQAGKAVHGIVREYYGLSGTREFVYDNLPAEISKLDVILRNSSVKNMATKDLDDVVQVNFSVKALDDHVISFGGLSGGPTVNQRGEIIGINSTELGSEGSRVLERDGSIKYYPRVTLNLLPAHELKRALERLR